MFFTSTDRASTIPSNILLSIRDLLDRKISEEHLHSSNKSIYKQNKNRTETTKRKEQQLL